MDCAQFAFDIDRMLESGRLANPSVLLYIASGLAFTMVIKTHIPHIWLLLVNNPVTN